MTPTISPDPRPRVMQVITHLDLGGAEEVALALTEGLGRECAFTVFAVQGVPDTAFGRDMRARLRRLDVPVEVGTPLDIKAGGLLHAGARLRRALRRVRPDVVHLHTDIPDATYAASLLFGADPAGLRVVRTVHNTTLWPKWRRVGKWVERRLEHAHHVAVSEDSLASLHEFRARQGLGRLPDGQCEVVYNGVAYRGQRPATRPPGPARVLFAGRFEPQKGADLLPAILGRAAELTPEAAEVTLLGQGTLGGFLKRWVDTPPLRWPVTLAPPVPGLSARLGDFDVVLMPSRFEGFGLLAAEALLAGTPVVASDVDGLRELFPPGYPLLAEPGDVEGFARRLAAVVEAPGDYARQARALVAPTEARFGLARMTQAYLGLYRAGAHGAAALAPGARTGGVPA